MEFLFYFLIDFRFFSIVCLSLCFSCLHFQNAILFFLIEEQFFLYVCFQYCHMFWKKALKRKRNKKQEILKQKTIFPISFSALLPKMAFVLFGLRSVFCLEQFSSSVYEYDCSCVFLILTQHLFFLHRHDLSATVFRPRLRLDGRLITHFYHSYEHSLAHSHDHSLISSLSISTWLTNSF